MATGIDFGTTNSVVSQWNGEDIDVLALDSEHLEEEWFYPSFKYLFPTIVGETSLRLGTLFGWEAKLRSNRVIEACKRMLQDDGGVSLRDRRVSATSVAAGVFHAMRERAEANLTTIDSAVITVPANAKGGARYRTRAAARAAGIEVKALLNEPTAAALSYMHDIQEEGTIMVFDWGGGTIDVTVLEHRDGVFEERASRGITQLGGLEIDKRLRGLLIDKIGREPELSPAEQRQLALAVERTKIRLSAEETVLTRVPGSSRLIEISRDELEERIGDLVEQSLEPARMCLNDLGIDTTGVSDILLIGGTSQMPCVRDAVERLMDTETAPAELCHPMTAVSRGAAIAAAILDKELDSFLQVSSMYALGTVTKRKDDPKPSFSEIIKARSPLPIRERKSYTPNSESPSSLKIQIWEADPDKPLEHPENFQLTTLEVRYPRPISRRDAAFTLEYTYQDNGLLHVRAVLDKTGEVLLDQEVSDFTHGQNLSVAQIQREMTAMEGLPSAPVPQPPSRPAPTVGFQAPVTTTAAQPAVQPQAPAAPQPEASSQPEAAPQAETAPNGECFVVDGSNLAWLGGNAKATEAPSLIDLLEAVAALKEQYPGASVDIVIDATLPHRLPFLERQELEKLCRSGAVNQAPAGTKGKADMLVATVAARKKAVVVTNDSFKELQEEFPWLLEGDRVLGASYVGGEWVFLPRQPVRRRNPGVNGL